MHMPRFYDLHSKTLLPVVCLLVNAFSAQIVVNETVDNAEGSLRTSIDQAQPGDTIVFALPDHDTIILYSDITISKEITVTGNNEETGNTMTVRMKDEASYPSNVFTITGGNVILKEMVLLGGNSSPDSGGVLRIQGSSTRVHLENAVICRGRGPGGAVFNDSATVIFSACTLSNNSSSQRGGAIYNTSGNVTLDNCVISKNSASSSGGAVYSRSGTVTLVNCAISENSGSSGGAIGSKAGSVIIRECTIENNHAHTGGGIYNYNADITLESSTIEMNTSIYSSTFSSLGGGIYNQDGSLTFKRSRVSDNQAFYKGGGIYNASGTVIFDSSSIERNSSGRDYDGHDDASFSSSQSISCYGGGIFNERGTIHLTDATISENTAFVDAIHVNNAGNETRRFAYSSCGGGIFSDEGEVRMHGCTVADNTANVSATTGSSIVAIYSAAYGGGIYSRGRLMVSNSTFFGNRARAYGYALSWYNKEESEAGGAILNCGTAMLVNSTVTQNSSGIHCSQAVTRLLNTVDKENTEQEPFSSLAVHSLISAESSAILINCISGSEPVFGTPTPELTDNGGLTRTVAIHSSQSPLIGSGTRAGIYNRAERINNTDTSLSCFAYFDPTRSAWVSLLDTGVVSDETVIQEITTDQRGKQRGDPPCIGAFELSAEDPLRMKAQAPASTIRNAGFSSQRISFNSTGIADAELQVFDMSGRRIYHKQLTAKKGRNIVAIPPLKKGILVYRLSMASEIKQHKVLHIR